LDACETGASRNQNQIGIYETEPGSKKFFIVDYLENTADQVSYGRPEYPKTPTNGRSSSFSNWHSSLSNKLTVPSFYPRFSIPHKVYNCSCDEDESYINYLEDMGARAQRFVAIYMLPGSERPTFDNTNIFEVEYQYIYQETACSRSID
jgi:hypothetical protein